VKVSQRKWSGNLIGYLIKITRKVNEGKGAINGMCPYYLYEGLTLFARKIPETSYPMNSFIAWPEKVFGRFTLSVEAWYYRATKET
jgi:hypothetical protein